MSIQFRLSDLLYDCAEAQILPRNWELPLARVAQSSRSEDSEFVQCAISVKIPGHSELVNVYFSSSRKDTFFKVGAANVTYDLGFYPEVLEEGYGVYRVKLYTPHVIGWPEKILALGAARARGIWGWDKNHRQVEAFSAEDVLNHLILECYTGTALKREVFGPEDYAKVLTRISLKSYPESLDAGLGQKSATASEIECSQCAIQKTCGVSALFMERVGVDGFAGLRPQEEGSKLIALYEHALGQEEQIKIKKQFILGRLRALADSGEIPAMSGHFAATFKGKAWYPFEPVFSLLVEAGFWDSSFGSLKVKEIDALLDRLPPELKETIISYRKEFDKSVDLEWEGGNAGSNKTRTSIFGRMDKRG